MNLAVLKKLVKPLKIAIFEPKLYKKEVIMEQKPYFFAQITKADHMSSKKK